MNAEGCPTCHAIYHLLVSAEPDVVRRALAAHEKGPGFGVLVGLPDELGAESADEARELEASREQGYFVGVARVEKLIQMVPATGHDLDQIAGILGQLQRPPPEGQVHVLALLDGCVAAITARASAELVAARDADEARLRRIYSILEMAEPEVLRLSSEKAPPLRSVFLAVAPDDPLLRPLRIGEGATRDANARGVYVGLHDAADVIAALPLEGLEVEDGVRAANRLTAPKPEGAVRVVAVHNGHITVVTRPPAPGFLTLT